MLKYLNVDMLGVTEHAEVLVLLDLNVFETAVHHVLLLQLEELHVSGGGREDDLEEKPGQEEGVLEVQEERDLLRGRPTLVLMGGKDQQDDVCGGSYPAVDIEGRGPGLVALRPDRERSLHALDETVGIEPHLREGDEQGCHAHPGGRHGEERSEAVVDQGLVEVVEAVVLGFFACTSAGDMSARVSAVWPCK